MQIYSPSNPSLEDDNSFNSKAMKVMQQEKERALENEKLQNPHY
jgi:hypothetical protein